MLQLTDEDLSRVQDLCRVLPPWKRGDFLQELTLRMQGREFDHADLRREAATAMRAVLGRGHAWAPESEMAPSELAEMQATRRSHRRCHAMM